MGFGSIAGAAGMGCAPGIGIGGLRIGAGIACGGGGSKMTTSIIPLAQRSAQFVWSAVPGFSTQKPLPKPSAEASPFMQAFTANAQNPIAPTVALTGNYSGFCQAILFQHQRPPADQRVNLPIYGLGRWNIGACGSTDWQTEGSPPRLDAAGAPVVGDGLLSNLVVLAKGISADSLDGKVEVWVVGQSQPTPITCTLGTSRKCTDTLHTATVKDGDEILITITVLPQQPTSGELSSALHHVRVLLGKQ